MPPGSHRMVLYFISLIQKQPHLYDSENVHYKDKYKKDKTWEQIAQKMGLSGKIRFLCTSLLSDIIC